MGDEDRKPRHRLGADELLEETNGAISKIINLLQSNGLAAESVEHLASLAKVPDFMVRCRHRAMHNKGATYVTSLMLRPSRGGKG